MSTQNYFFNDHSLISFDYKRYLSKIVKNLLFLYPGEMVQALIQRVSKASVSSNNTVVGSINKGLLVFLGVQAIDTQSHAIALIDKILKFRIFEDQLGKMNLNIQQAKGELLVISQFTLGATTHKGNRPGFSSLASKDKAFNLYDFFIQTIKDLGQSIEKGAFGEDMQVSLTNDGPVTFFMNTDTFSQFK